MKLGQILLFLTLTLPLATLAQVHVDHAIELTGSGMADRQVLGLPGSTEPNAVLTAGTEQRGDARTAIVGAGSTWNLDLPGLGTTPAIGTHVVVKAPVPTPGPIALTLNGTALIPLRKGDLVVDGSSVTEGEMLSMVFTGSVFQLINGRTDLRRNCPSGMVAVNAQYCIEPTERPASDFFQAGLLCAGQDRRLCTWGEWYAACQQATALGLVGMTNNYEWTNNTSNENNSVRITGQDLCESVGNGLATGSAARPARCCYTR
ncbi:MAG: hypothetical protein IPO87_10875 [Flavobacteriales bacterium]|nr:hypothetical protein [Flavobacteriales bacterium]